MFTTISRCIQLYAYQTSRIKNYFNVTTCGKQNVKQNVQL